MPVPNPKSKSNGTPQDLSIDWNPVDWWNSWFGNVSNWLGGLGGDIASGIEAGFVTLLKDIWAVVLPYMEIGIGLVIAIIGINIWILSSSAGQQAAASIFRAAL